jgi:hypothetical protein
VEVLANCNEEKQKILRNMMFDGLMHLPKGDGESDRPFKLQFSFWLLTKLDSRTAKLQLGKRGNIPILVEHVGLVLGLTTKGQELAVHDPSKLEMNKSIIKKNLMLDEADEIDLDNIRKVLQRDILNDEDERIKIAFRTAVVIYAVSYFLAPRGRPPKVNTEIFDSITNPEKIFKINWSSYVLKTLRESSSKIQSDILAGKSSVCLDGCLLFLQVT